MRAKELQRHLKSKQPPLVIDVRSSIEYRTGHIPGAIHAPMWKIMFRLTGLPDDKKAEIVIACEHGPRAHMVQGLLARRGYLNLKLLEGHMKGWRGAGLEMQK